VLEITDIHDKVYSVSETFLQEVKGFEA
jgi:hypothetical protein